MNWYRVVSQGKVVVVCTLCAHAHKLPLLGDVFELAQTCALCGTTGHTEERRRAVRDRRQRKPPK